MPFTLKPRWRFIYRAVIEEFKRSRWYKAVSILTAAWFVMGVLSLFGVTLPTPKPSWRLAAFFLAFVIVVLLLVIEAIYRFHRRTVSNLYLDAQKAVQIVTRLTEIAGQGSLLDSMYHEREDEIPRELLENWLGGLRSALQDSFGPLGTSKFTNGHPEYLEVVPTSRHVWFLDLRQRLSEQIGHQSALVKQAKSDHERLGGE